MLHALRFLRVLPHKILDKAFQLVWPMGLEVEGGLIRENDNNLDSFVAEDNVLQGGEGARVGRFAVHYHVQVLVGHDDGKFPVLANNLAREDHHGALVVGTDLLEERSRHDLAGLELGGVLLRGKAALEGNDLFFALGQLGLEWLD